MLKSLKRLFGRGKHAADGAAAPTTPQPAEPPAPPRATPDPLDAGPPPLTEPLPERPDAPATAPVTEPAAEDPSASPRDPSAIERVLTELAADPAEKAAATGPLSVPAIWRRPRANRMFHEALPPLVIAAMTGRRLRNAPAVAEEERLLAGAELSDKISGGLVHVWGAGVAGMRPAPRAAAPRFTAPETGALFVHAARGPETAAALDAAGLDAPSVFGDPIWFAPRLFDLEGVEKTVELGVLRAARPGRDDAAEAPSEPAPSAEIGPVRFIDLDCAPTIEAWTAKAREIARCKRVLNTVAAMTPFLEAMRLPNALTAPGRGGGKRIALDDPTISPLARDLFGGLGETDALLYQTRPRAEIDYDDVIAAIDALWRPCAYDPGPFFEAAPFEVTVDLADPRWPCPGSLAEAEAGEASTPSPSGLPPEAAPNGRVAPKRSADREAEPGSDQPVTRPGSTGP